MIFTALLAWCLMMEEAPAAETQVEDHRTQVMSMDRELSELWVSSQGGASRERALARLHRHGRKKLVAVSGDSLLFVNARDLALSELAKGPVEDDLRAQELLEGEPMTLESLERLVSRYPRSKAATTALRQALQSPLSEEARREWAPLVLCRGLNGGARSAASPVPASVAFDPLRAFPLKATWKLVLSGPAFRPASFEGLQRGIYVEPLFPLAHLQWGEGLFIADPRGFKQILIGKEITQRVYATPERLFNHLDNNIAGDFLLHKGWAYVPLRSAPMIRDSQKDLYYVELSRHKIGAFRVGKGLDSMAEDPTQHRWSPAWTLEDDTLSFNAAPAVAGSLMLAAGSSLVGLFNVELACVDRETGRRLWTEPLASGQQELNYFGRHIRECHPGVPLVSGDRVWVSSNLGSLHCLDLGGRPLWARLYPRCPTPEPRQYYAHVDPRLTRFRNQPPVIKGGRLFAAPVDSPSLICLDPDSGRQLWSYSPFAHQEDPGFFWGKVYWQVLDEGVLITDAHSITLLDARDGKVLTSVRMPENFAHRPGRPLVCSNALVLASTGKLVVFSRPTLEVVKILDLSPQVSFEGVNIAFDGKFLALVDGRLNAPDYDLEASNRSGRPGTLWVLEAQEP